MDTNKFGAYTAHTMARLFGTNGIRGVFGEDMSLQFAHDITLSLAAHFGKGPVLVGYDGRHSGLAMAKTVCSTLNYAGLDCSLAGLVPTPCLEFAVVFRRIVRGSYHYSPGISKFFDGKFQTRSWY